MKLLTFALLIFINIQSAYGQEGNLDLVQRAMEKARGLKESCTQCGDATGKPLCSKITDDVCNEVWNGTNKGNMDVYDGIIRMGRSEKSYFSQSKLIDLKMILENQDGFPVDLKMEAADFFKKLKPALENENKSDQWLSEIADLDYEWSKAIRRTYVNRTESTHPELKTMDPEDLTVEQAAVYKKNKYELQNKILEIKYKQSPQWQRVERVFKTARADLIESISKLKIDDQLKSEMKKKIASVKLSLPYPDPRILGSSSSCGTTTVNAYYTSDFNKFTICLGFANTFQSDSVLYGTIAHELSHSIDSSNLSNDKYKRESEIFKALKPLVNSRQAPFSCKEWENIKKKTLEPVTIANKPSKLEKLYECMGSVKKVHPFNESRVSPIIEQFAYSDVSDDSTYKNFTRLVQPTYEKFGKELKNEFYLRPDKFVTVGNDYIERGDENENISNLEIFNQTFKCNLEALKDNEKAFTSSISETREIKKTIYADYVNFCGQRCASLVDYNLAINVQEKFADWLAYKALSERLSRENNVEIRRKSAAYAVMDLCSLPGIEKAAPHYSRIEKEFSLRPHPDDRIRRLSVFNSQIADLAECLTDTDSQKGFGLCEP